MRKITLTETELINLINTVINEGKYPDNRFGICLCPPPWTPCGCLGEAMSLGIPPEDMNPADFTGNDDDFDGGQKYPCPPGQVMGKYGCESRMPDSRRLNEQSSGTITQAMIQQCKHLLNNVQGTNASWKQNFKSAVMGKKCSWIRARMSFFGNKASNAIVGSGAYKRYKAKSHFLECLLSLCQS